MCKAVGDPGRIPRVKGTEASNGRTRTLTISSLVLMEYEMSGGRKWARQKQEAYMLRYGVWTQFYLLGHMGRESIVNWSVK